MSSRWSPREGGVLVRAGHTEAAVDISRMAGLYPAGVICEVMNDDGTMARLPDLVAFAQLHGLKVGTIADLIAYRRRTERHGRARAETTVRERLRRTVQADRLSQHLDGTEHVALTKGKIDPKRPTLVRMHQVDFAADLLGHVEARQRLRAAVAEGDLRPSPARGVVVFLRDPQPDVAVRAPERPG